MAALGLSAELENQSPIFENVNLFATDLVLREAMEREGGGRAAARLEAFGEIAGSRQALEWGRLANEYPPKLKTHDPKGRRLDMVEFHPAYHELMGVSTRAGIHCSVWAHLAGSGRAQPGRNVARAGAFYMTAQMESGHCCPITMTNAAIALLARHREIADVWLPLLLVEDYDPSFRPAQEKRALTVGMGMTERQGGTDVRTNTTRAIPTGRGGPGEEYLITGHKWFMSAPMSDAFLVLAQAPRGLSCFLMPRFLPDGEQNPIRIQRLKDKLGNRSNASSEVEFENSHAWMVGEEGRGVATIIDMVTATRLDCAISSAGLMRWALANALHHCRYRTVFQRKLIDQPLMRQVLADLALDHEAAVALVFRLARAFDRAEEDEAEAAFARVMTPVVKYWVCKVLPGFAYEAMECLGGNGYVEEGPAARLFRESPINAIWEGSGNVMCLDLLRVAEKSPEGLRSVLDELGEAAEGEPRLLGPLEAISDRLASRSGLESDLRSVVERLAHLAAAALLTRNAPQAVADAYLATRLSGSFARTYGMLGGADVGAILNRAMPAP